MCSAEEPTVIVPKLRSAAGRIQGMMKGYYKLSGSKVSERPWGGVVRF